LTLQYDELLADILQYLGLSEREQVDHNKPTAKQHLAENNSSYRKTLVHSRHSTQTLSLIITSQINLVTNAIHYPTNCNLCIPDGTEKQK
jgi:hypothetical protein